MVRLLVEYGANVNSQLKVSLGRLTPLMLAAQFGVLDVAQVLVENGAVVQQKGWDINLNTNSLNFKEVKE